MPRAAQSASLPLLAGLFLLIACLARAAYAQENPYFVTEHHHLPEPGALGIADYSVGGIPKAGNGFVGSEMEFEYRPAKWWATALTLHGQSTLRESTIFTGYSWTNKFKLAPQRKLPLSPVLVVKWEDVSEADKTVAEIEGHASREDFAIPNAAAREERAREFETKLILSRDYRGWNFAGNVMAAKELTAAPWQFGYSFGVNRPLAAAKSDQECNLCRRAFSAGMELYGGLGDADQFGLSRTAHYAGPAISWAPANGVALKLAPHFGLTPESQRAFVHAAVIYDLPDFKQRLGKWFH